MKRLIVGILAIIVLSVGGIASADTNSPPVPTATTAVKPPSVIDEIEVPFDVVMYAQDTYQGMAITEARKISRDGKQMYQLRVDKDDQSNDYESFYLLYDSKWNLVGKDTMKPPARPKQSAPAPTTTTQEQAPAPKPEGGRGSGEPTASDNSGTGTTDTDTTTGTTDNSGTGSGDTGTGTGTGDTTGGDTTTQPSETTTTSP